MQGDSHKREVGKLFNIQVTISVHEAHDLECEQVDLQGKQSSIFII